MKKIIVRKLLCLNTTKLSLKMRLTTVLLVISLFKIQANTYSQNTKITLNLKDASVLDVLNIIESKTEFSFFYNNLDIDVDRKVSVKVRRTTISEILDKLLYGTNLLHDVMDRQIVLYPKTSKPPEKWGFKPIKIQQREVKGTIIDENGVPLPGATVLIEGSTRGVSTDFDGNFSIQVSDSDILVISYVGYLTQKIPVNKKLTITVVLKADNALDEIVLVSFGKQKKSSVISSVTSIKPSELKIPSSNLTTALAGRVSGLIAYQRSGEPGRDNAEFFVRGITSFGDGGNSPLILIDGVELSVQDLARLTPDDIADFSILKDAPATALYGARGANGAVYVTTKEGVQGPLAVNFRYESSISRSTRDIEIADPITYMRLYNEAVRTRDPLNPIPFSEEKISRTISGENPILYPAVDWQEQLFSDFTNNQRANFSVRGGGKKARFYVSTTFSQDKGILNVPKINDFNSNIDLKRIQLRSNVNVNLAPKTKLKLAFNAAYDDYNGPIAGGEDVYVQSLRTSPVLFQPFYEKDEANKFTRHILFGSILSLDGLGGYYNPYADLARGFREDTGSTIIAKIDIDQDLSSITEGLNLRLVVSNTRRSTYSAVRSYNPFYYTTFFDKETKETQLLPLNSGLTSAEPPRIPRGSEVLSFNRGGDQISSATYLEFNLNYAKTFSEKHDVGGLLVFTRNNRIVSISGNNLQQSLPFRNEGLSGRFTYGYDNRYFAEFNFGLNGSERFSKKERYGFFPALAMGWAISNENFLKDSDVISNLKLKGSYGIVGNDNIGRPQDRFYYLSNTNLNDGARSLLTGNNFNTFTAADRTPGVSISRYANEDITWETGKKLNLGLELGLFNDFTVEVDYFSEKRTNIFTRRIVPSSLGLQAESRANIGEAKSSGIDISLDYNKSFNENFWIQGRGSFTFARSKILKTEEPDYSETPWRSRIGQSITQQFGYVAERLFVDHEEVINSPRQFGEYTGGDIKYKDIDGNGVIDDLDQVPLGNPDSPEIVYGFGFSAGYKNFDFSCFFQGAANSTFWIDTRRTAPFLNIKYSGDRADFSNFETTNQLLKVWADSHWSEENKDLYAKWPRLSADDNVIENNQVRSSWFMHNGAYLRFKSVEIGYSLPKSFVSKYNLNKFRIYFSGTNLLTVSGFKLWDPELAGNGLGYPSQKVFNLGINISI